MRGCPQDRRPHFTGRDLNGDALGLSPGSFLVLGFWPPIAGKRELARIAPVLVLVNHPADGFGINSAPGAIDDHLRHRALTAVGFTSCLEVDGFCETGQLI